MSVIVCDICNCEFEDSDIDIKKATTKLKDKTFEVVFYKCPKCGKPYVICLLDYQASKLQKAYVDARNKFIKLQNKYEQSAASILRLEQKQEKIENLKKEALDYQKTLIEQYANLLPEEIFN